MEGDIQKQCCCYINTAILFYNPALYIYSIIFLIEENVILHSDDDLLVHQNIYFLYRKNNAHVASSHSSRIVICLFLRIKNIRVGKDTLQFLFLKYYSTKKRKELMWDAVVVTSLGKLYKLL